MPAVELPKANAAKPERRVSMKNRRTQQAGAIAIRRNGHALEVCLIRKKGSKKWGIPKGMVEPRDTYEQTALSEAWEEAGLKGKLLGGAVGTYEYEKWDTAFVVTVYAMEVLEQHDKWQEAGIRKRRWASFAKATSLLRDHPALPLLDRVRRVVAKGVKHRP